MAEGLLENVQNICRLCLNIQQKLINIFNYQDLESLKIQIAISELCSIKLMENDSLPKCICKPCKKKLFSIQKFIHMCKDSDNKLHKIYEMQLKKSIERKSVNTCDISVQTENTEIQQYSHIAKRSTLDIISKDIDKDNDETSNLDHPSIPTKADESIFSCDTCSKTFPSKISLKSHIQFHETESANNQIIQSLPETLEDANPVENNLNATQNVLSQDQVHITEECNVDLTKKSKNKKQIETESVMRSDNKFLCDICSKTLQTESGLRLHLKMHTGLKPFKCKVCDKGFAIESYKKRHELTHSRDKLFMCHLCSASFASANGFKYHLMAHAGESKHSCNICGKSFIRYKYLKEHIFTHTGEKPYVCKLCGVGYSNSGSLFAHEKKCKGSSKLKKYVKSKNSSSEIVSNVYTNLQDIKNRVIILKSNVDVK